MKLYSTICKSFEVQILFCQNCVHGSKKKKKSKLINTFSHHIIKSMEKVYQEKKMKKKKKRSIAHQPQRAPLDRIVAHCEDNCWDIAH